MLFWTDGLCPATARFIEHPIKIGYNVERAIRAKH